MIYIKYKQTVEEEYAEQYSDEPYDYSWSRVSHFEVIGAFLEEPGGYSHETFNLDFRKGDELYALTVIFSDGDTFGQGVGNGEVVWVFKTEQYAKKAEALFWENRDKDSIKFENEDGETITLSNPGSGYFETLDEVRIYRVIVQ